MTGLTRIELLIEENVVTGASSASYWRRIGLVAVTSSVLLTLAACGSSSDAGGSGEADPAAVAACEKATDAYFATHENEPSVLPEGFTPLSKPPASGGKIITVATGAVPSAIDSSDQTAAAAAEIGWSHELISYDGTVQDLSGKLSQAIAAKPEVVTLAGVPVAAIQGPIQEAKDAGVVLALSSVPDSPISIPGFAAVSGNGDTQAAAGERNAFMALKDSDCNAKVLTITAPLPILKFQADKFESTLSENCDACKNSSLEIQLADIGTPAGTNAIISALQVDPSIKYVNATFGNVVAGLPAALTQANMSGIKIFGTTPDASALKPLQDGQDDAGWWVTYTGQLDGWLIVDAALRAIDEGKPVTGAPWPLGVLTSANVPDGDSIPAFPGDYEEQFVSLWTGK